MGSASNSDDEVFESLRPPEREAGPTPEGYGDDSTPLVSTVRDPHPSNWGSLTSSARTASAAYMKFLKGVR
jgi:hypothetical protein